jgi:hypothetical protein
MGNIWRLVIRPDKSICLASQYVEDETIVQLTPRLRDRSLTRGDRYSIQSLCALQFLGLVIFGGKNILGDWLMICNLVFTLFVMYFIRCEYIINLITIHIFYTTGLIVYGFFEKIPYVFATSLVYNAIYTYHIIKDLIRD